MSRGIDMSNVNIVVGGNGGNAFDLGDVPKMKMSGIKKTAILLLTLGEDLAPEVLRKLDKEQIKKIGVELASIEPVKSDERQEVINEFISINNKGDYLLEGGMPYTQKLLTSALGEKESSALIEGIKYEAYTKVFTSARNADVGKLLNCLKDESPQTIAIVLHHIQQNKAGKILSQLPLDMKCKVSERLGSISKISPSLIKSVDKALEKKLNDLTSKTSNNLDGVESLVGVLSNVSRKTEKEILAALDETNPQLAQAIRDNMFVFEDIVNLDGLTIQRILRELDLGLVALAISNADEAIQNAILSNQSKKAAESLKDEISMLGVVKISKMEEAQSEILSIMRRLESEGAISLAKGGGDEYIV